MPRGDGGSGSHFHYNFGSDRYLLLLTWHGSYYEVIVVDDPELPASATPDMRWVGVFEVGSIAEVAAEAEELMRSILREEGKDDESFC